MHASGGLRRGRPTVLEEELPSQVRLAAVDDEHVDREQDQRPERVGRDREHRGEAGKPRGKDPEPAAELTPRQTDSAARASRTPNPITIQPQLFRSLRMYEAPATKKCELETAAIPQTRLRTPPITSMTPANRTQPAPLYDRSLVSYDRSNSISVYPPRLVRVDV
jgi:hypothetical protein